MEILDPERVRSYFPPRRRAAHKGDFGKILLLCGSEGYTGAAGPWRPWGLCGPGQGLCIWERPGASIPFSPGSCWSR